MADIISVRLSPFKHNQKLRRSSVVGSEDGIAVHLAVFSHEPFSVLRPDRAVLNYKWAKAVGLTTTPRLRSNRAAVDSSA